MIFKHVASDNLSYMHGKTEQYLNIASQVKDIYGGAYELLGLPGDLTASSFGKTQRDIRADGTVIFYISWDLNRYSGLNVVS